MKRQLVKAIGDSRTVAIRGILLFCFSIGCAKIVCPDAPMPMVFRRFFYSKASFLGNIFTQPQMDSSSTNVAVVKEVPAVVTTPSKPDLNKPNDIVGSDIKSNTIAVEMANHNLATATPSSNVMVLKDFSGVLAQTTSTNDLFNVADHGPAPTNIVLSSFDAGGTNNSTIPPSKANAYNPIAGYPIPIQRTTPILKKNEGYQDIKRATSIQSSYVWPLGDKLYPYGGYPSPYQHTPPASKANNVAVHPPSQVKPFAPPPRQNHRDKQR